MRRCIPITGAAILVAAPVFAHDGSRIWIDNVGGTIVTFKADDDESPSSYTPSRIFDSELLNFGIFQTDFPGYEVVQTGAQVSPGTTFGFNITGPLLFYDDTLNLYLSTKSKFGPPQPGPVPQMAVSLEEQFRETGDRRVSGFSFFNYFGTGDHGHLSYTVLPFDPPFNPPTGVYALPLALTGTGLAESDPYFILLGKGVTPGSMLFNEAHTVMQAMLDFPGDANFDSKIDAVDLTRLAQHWQGSGTWADGDFNFDGIVDARDLVILAEHWYEGVDNFAFSPTSIPEPATGLLIASIPILMQRRRRW